MFLYHMCTSSFSMKIEYQIQQPYDTVNANKLRNYGKKSCIFLKSYFDILFSPHKKKCSRFLIKEEKKTFRNTQLHKRILIGKLSDFFFILNHNRSHFALLFFKTSLINVFNELLSLLTKNIIIMIIKNIYTVSIYRQSVCPKNTPAKNAV